MRTCRTQVRWRPPTALAPSSSSCSAGRAVAGHVCRTPTGRSRDARSRRHKPDQSPRATSTRMCCSDSSVSDRRTETKRWHRFGWSALCTSSKRPLQLPPSNGPPRPVLTRAIVRGEPPGGLPMRLSAFRALSLLAYLTCSTLGGLAYRGLLALGSINPLMSWVSGLIIFVAAAIASTVTVISGPDYWSGRLGGALCFGAIVSIVIHWGTDRQHHPFWMSVIVGMVFSAIIVGYMLRRPTREML